MDYLFFLLTEDYIESNRKIAESLAPLLTKFAQDLGDSGALVKPFPGGARDTLGDIIRKAWSNDQIMRMRQDLPAILVTDVDFDDFDPRISNYLYISLRDSINKYGDVEIFTLAELLSELILGARIKDLFNVANDYLKAQKNKETWQAALESLELKPGAFGISLDLKKGIEFLKSLRS
jgi:hypothetical protein